MKVCIEDIIKSENEDYRIDCKRIYYDIEKKLITDALSNKLNVVIDRTNINAKRRKRFIDIAQQYKKEREQQTQKPMELKIICKYFKMDLETSKNIYRKINNIPEEKSWEVEEIFDRMEMDFEEPALDEGFDEIITVLPEDFIYNNK